MALTQLTKCLCACSLPGMTTEFVCLIKRDVPVIRYEDF